MSNVELVYISGMDHVNIPRVMGTPRADQLQGTPLEQLSEVAGRICYDSLGTGRDSQGYHQHIQEVKHLNVYEHPWINVDCYNFNIRDLALACINRKGIWLNHNGMLSINARAIIEWERHSQTINHYSDIHHKLIERIREQAHCYMPMIFKDSKSGVKEISTVDHLMISMYMRGSRGWSHEQVRHRYSISQRSTRYVDESGSEYIQHPLVKKFLADESVPSEIKKNCSIQLLQSEGADKIAYDALVQELQEYLIKRGVDKFNARKQARGAARGYLGNALATEMIFTAPISGWDWMIQNRATEAADAEIRERFVEVVQVLQANELVGESFAGYGIREAKDGLGLCVYILGES